MSTEKFSFEQLKYRTKDGKADYCFLFAEIRRESWIAYISSQPSYGNCSECLHSTLRMKDRKRLLVATPPQIKTLREIKKHAAEWAEFTQEYIRKGNAKSDKKTFIEGQQREMKK
ncbi:MAG: hypothetical protein KAU22_06725 [Desulfuromonadales bacterium]|nr:hypothetical protein [Desulfuromonadales bacterium]